MNVNRKIDVLGRVVIPAEFRNALGLGDGDVVNISCENGKITIESAREICKLCGSHESVIDGKICRKCVNDVIAIAKN